VIVECLFVAVIPVFNFSNDFEDAFHGYNMPEARTKVKRETQVCLTN
jgi:hypothetical protein